MINLEDYYIPLIKRTPNQVTHYKVADIKPFSATDRTSCLDITSPACL